MRNGESTNLDTANASAKGRVGKITSRWSLANFSISLRLPLLIAALLCGVIIVSTWASYRGVRDSAHALARERLQNLTQQFGGLLQQSATTQGNRTVTAANDAAVREYLRDRSKESQDRTINLFEPFAPGQEQNALSVELWDRDGAVVLRVPQDAEPGPTDVARELKQAATEPFKSVGHLRPYHDTIGYPIVASVRSPEGEVLGHIVRWRKLSTNPEARRQLTDLVGSQATLFLGNADGEVWTDMVRTVSRPPVNLSDTLQLTRYSRDKNPVMAMGRPIAGTPWFLVTEFPERPVWDQSRQFLRRMIFIGVLLLVVGTSLTLILSRSITQPLHQLTTAAESISKGDFSRTVKAQGKDELSTLATAFNTMAERVRESQEGLERKIAERTSELENANKELESFSYSVSHDLRAPLRTINGFAHVLREDFGSSLPVEALPTLARIEEGVQQMDQLVDDLLRFSRLSRQPLEKMSVSPAKIARDALEELEAEKAGRKLKISFGNMPVVKADPGLLKQVYANLLSNSLKYTRDRDPAEIELGTLPKADGDTVLYVRDNGAGFDMRYADKLFGVFQRLHGQDEFEGTGVGLAIAQRIIQRHGGRIWATAEVNKGATFMFQLPE